jgi:hypothetical protein
MDNESYIDVEFGCILCGKLDCDCQPETQPNPFDRYRIRRVDPNNIAIQELKGNPEKANWETISYHGNSLNSLLTGVFNVIVAQHTPTDDKLDVALEKLRLELVSSVAKVEKMIKVSDCGTNAKTSFGN